MPVVVFIFQEKENNFVGIFQYFILLNTFILERHAYILNF